ncbi:TetR/AcrR family transcriptional regulator [Kutzneria sp. CA-103260]|uniref:TetR/AcrR family transcriptional regulator n=1 Tax=Kutzneria sp. CA-103260 TaxID=2802641 RepID=UPI001BADF2E4|nr:TetR/AcrR family transcriptional regulator [Kutzneria sp. CA-103260]
MTRSLRADSERTVRAILDAARRALARDPAATLQQIADEAGVARTTVHRRFASREALLDALMQDMLEQMEAVLDDSRPQTAPPLVALHEMTAGYIRVKAAWRFHDIGPSAAHEDVIGRLMAKNRAMFQRLADSGTIAPDTDLDWAVRVYFALLHEAIERRADTGNEPDTLAALVTQTLVGGLRGM